MKKTLPKIKIVHSSQFTVHSFKKTFNFHFPKGNVFLSTFNSKPGSIFVLAIIFLFFVISISVVTFTNVTNFFRFGTKATLNEQAINLAEAGIDYAIWQLNEVDENYEGTQGTHIPLGAGEFGITINSAGANKKIVATGYIPNFADFNIKAKTQVEASSDASSWQIVRGTYKFTK